MNIVAVDEIYTVVDQLRNILNTPNLDPAIQTTYECSIANFLTYYIVYYTRDYFDTDEGKHLFMFITSLVLSYIQPDKRNNYLYRARFYLQSIAIPIGIILNTLIANVTTINRYSLTPNPFIIGNVQNNYIQLIQTGITFLSNNTIDGNNVNILKGEYHLFEQCITNV